MISAFRCNFLLILIIFSSCKDYKKEPSFKKHSITIINFGGADTTFNKVNTKGFGINNYTFIDLNTDSVFTRQKYELEEPMQITLKAGTLKNLGKNDTIFKGLAALSKLPDGFIKGTETNIDQIFCYSGPHAYLEHQVGNEKRFYFFTHYQLDSTIENMSRLLLSLNRQQGLQELDTAINFNEDKILLPVLNLNGMETLVRLQ